MPTLRNVVVCVCALQSPSSSHQQEGSSRRRQPELITAIRCAVCFFFQFSLTVGDRLPRHMATGWLPKTGHSAPCTLFTEQINYVMFTGWAKTSKPTHFVLTMLITNSICVWYFDMFTNFDEICSHIINAYHQKAGRVVTEVSKMSAL